MKVFCYDLTLATLWAARRATPGFLLHDSTILRTSTNARKPTPWNWLPGRRRARVQYICCLTPTYSQEDFSEGFSLQPYVRIELTDEGENGGLLGIRY